jgi:hypothetical protein
MATHFYTNHKELSQDKKQQIVDYLLAGRLSNSGYDWNVFKSMSAQRSRLRAILRLADINKLNWRKLSLEDFEFKDGTLCRYIIFWSFNEDITWRMQELVSKNKN